MIQKRNSGQSVAIIHYNPKPVYCLYKQLMQNLSSTYNIPI